MIAALRTPRRTIAAGFGFIACARFLTAGALHQHAATLAVGDQPVLAGRLEWLFRRLRIGVFTFGYGLALHRTRKIRARQGRNPRTGDMVAVEAKRVPFFRTGKELRAGLNGAERDAETRSA